jgi:cob(I)alamin adenosyltransferase
MVYLNRIYTKTGDAGETSLGDGRRVSKTDARIAAYGGADELNAVLGVALAEGLPDPIADRVRAIQNDLFDLGADLCVPETDEDETSRLRVSAEQVAVLETWIDETSESLEPLESFILPGGTPAAARLHHARTVCRRVEIGVLELAKESEVNPQVAVYLNRLSDLLFVWARVANNGGRDDVLWVPGKNRET